MAFQADQGKIAPRARMRRVAAVAALVLGFQLSPASASVLGAVKQPDPGTMLVPHRAVYDLTLRSADDKTGITTLSGRMVLEFAGSSCEGYTLNMQVITRINAQSGSVNVADTRTTSWEAGDGSVLRFGTWQYMNGRLHEKYQGRARRGSDERPGIAKFVEPKTETFRLGPGAIFPVEHMRQIMGTATAGENMLRSEVFDGADGKKVYAVVSFIGNRRAPGESDVPEEVENAGKLEALESWPVSLSYFEMKKELEGEQTPDHVTRFLMFANGVSTELILDYGDFSVDGKLISLELFDRPDC